MTPLDEMRALLDQWCAYWKRDDIFGPERQRMFDVQNEVAERVKCCEFRTAFTETYVRGHGAGYVLGYETAVAAFTRARNSERETR